MNKLKFSIIVLLNFFLINNLYSQNESHHEKLYLQNESYFNEVYKQVYDYITNSDEVKEFFQINTDLDSSCFCASDDVIFLNNLFFIDDIIEYEFNVDSNTKKILREVLIRNEIEKQNLVNHNCPVLYKINKHSNCSDEKCSILIYFSPVKFSPIHGDRVRADVFLTNKYVSDRRDAFQLSIYTIIFLFYFKEGKIEKVFLQKYS